MKTEESAKSLLQAYINNKAETTLKELMDSIARAEKLYGEIQMFPGLADALFEEKPSFGKLRSVEDGVLVASKKEVDEPVTNGEASLLSFSGLRPSNWSSVPEPPSFQKGKCVGN